MGSSEACLDASVASSISLTSISQHTHIPGVMPSPPENSLLNLLNPYASVVRSVTAAGDRDDDSGDTSTAPPDSPSAVLLRELQSASSDNNPKGSGVGVGGQLMSRGRSRASGTGASPPLSPTPKPGRSASSSSTSGPSPASASASGGSSIPAAIRPSHLLEDSSSDDEGPPASLMFDAGQQTPTRQSPRGHGAPTAGLPAGGLALPPRWAKGKDTSRSPGPFRRRPSSTSSSTQSPTSPGRPADVLPPLAAIPAIPMISGTSTESSSHSPTTSTDTEELVADTHPLVQPRRISQLPPESPPTPGPSSARTRTKGKHKYHALGTDERRRSSGSRDRQPSVRRAGLSGYNKALWKWVNVVDLDGFLQEVSCSSPVHS